MKLLNSRKALVLGGLLTVILAGGCTAGQGYSNNPYGYTSGYGTSYPYNSGYASSYPYTGGYQQPYQQPYPYTGSYQNPYYQYQQNKQTYNQQYRQNQQTFNQQYQKNLQTYNQQHPNNPYNQPIRQQAYGQQHQDHHPYNKRTPGPEPPVNADIRQAAT